MSASVICSGMRYLLAMFFMVVCTSVCSVEDQATVAVTAELRQSYRVSSGDEISVGVFGESELSVSSVRIGEDGRIRMPFVGDVDVVGKTVVEIEASITGQLSDGYLVDPKVSVQVTRYRQVFIDGEVRKPGSFDYQPGLTVRKLVTLAGGLTERASTRRINLVTGGEAAGNSRKAKLDDLLRPGDQVTVDQSFF